MEFNSGFKGLNGLCIKGTGKVVPVHAIKGIQGEQMYSCAHF